MLRFIGATILALALLVGATLAVPAEPASDSEEVDFEALKEAGVPVFLPYFRVRELVPFVIPESPELPRSSKYSPFQCGPLEDILGEGIPRQNPAEFTVAEKMLAFGWRNPKAEDFWSLSNEEQLEYFREKRNRKTGAWLYNEFNPARETVDLWWWVLNNMNNDVDTVDHLFDYSLWGNALRDPEKEFIDDLLNKFTSPVTGKFIEFKCREFSPGNMYIDFIPDEVIEQYRADAFDQLWEPHVNPEPEGVVYMYYRVYGTKGVIRTGIFFGSPNRMGWLLGRT
ncbi:MAG: hypothetical protein A2Y63_06265 [Candidatus Riflebacteria bacterium RBG_13_59_9]|nr:MAG: hypothetical protein A2Y63_06265 [Candidatus Riflebacteria bacterium RBG_13_59_9]